ncbi:MAG: 3-dehydroquinate synthase [Acidilobaceae archaeon]
MRSAEFDLCNTRTQLVVGLGALGVLKSLEEGAVVVHSASIEPELVLENLKNPSLILRIRDGEEAKDLSNVLELLREIAVKAPPALQWIVAVGGGTVLDVVGFAASIYKRGVKLANVPTTLLAMVDAALGGKNGVNFAGAKNILGTFYHPRLVVSDTRFLETLPEPEVSNGMAEVVKYCVTLDRDLCDLIAEKREEVLSRDHEVLEEVIYRSAMNKMRVVAQDEREEKRVRTVLNFGHTVGHAIEAGSDFRVPHGRAVAVGMVCESLLAEELGVSKPGLADFVKGLLNLYKLPSSARELGVLLDIEKAVLALGRDKKRRGDSIDMPLPTDIGSWKRVQVSLRELEVHVERCLR